MMIRTRLLTAFGIALCGACVEKSETPLSPSVAGPIPGVEITQPKPLEPLNGAAIAVGNQPVTLLIENAGTSGVRPLSYLVEIATDAGFQSKVFEREGLEPGTGGRTSLRLPDPLATGRSYYWRTRAQDGANTGPYSGAFVFSIFTPIVIEQPTLLSPVNNAVADSLHPRFTVGAVPRSGPVGAITYEMEVATNDSFAVKVAIWRFNETGNPTVFTAPQDLAGNTQYFWRARAFDPTTTGPFSLTQVFRTPAPVVTTPPGGSCGPPFPLLPLAIVQCQRAKYPTPMSSSQTVAFLRALAKDLNAAQIGGGPYGLLRKTSGANCQGYSCDIICAGQGNAQQQRDVLIDAEGAASPIWSDAHVVPNIRVDVCEIQ
jgi:hypothetical protein